MQWVGVPLRAEVPVVIVLGADPSHSGTLWGQSYYLVDCGIAAQDLMPAAHAQGLRTVFVGAYDEVKVNSMLGIPAQVRVVRLFPLGYPAEERGPALRASRFRRYALANGGGGSEIKKRSAKLGSAGRRYVFCKDCAGT